MRQHIIYEGDEGNMSPILFLSPGTFHCQTSSSGLGGVGAQPPCPDTVTHVAGSAAVASFEDVAHDWKEQDRAVLNAETLASHLRVHARRDRSPALAASRQTRATDPSRRRLIASPHPETDALATGQRGGEWSVEDVDGRARNSTATSPPCPSLSPCPIRPGSEMGWRGSGRARAGGGSLGPVGGALPFHGPLDAFRDRGGARRSRGADAARALRVFGSLEMLISFHTPATSQTLFGRAA